MDVTLDNFGRIVIPKKIRDRLGIQPGSKLRLDVEEGDDRERLALEPLRDKPILQRRGRLLVHTGELVGDVEDAVQRDRDERIRTLTGL